MTVQYTQPRQYFPALWSRGNVPASASIQMGQAGAAYMDEFPAARPSSVTALVLVGTAVPSAGWIKAEITRNGVGTGHTAQFGQATGTKRRITDIAPGACRFNKEERLGILLTSSASLSPTTIDVAVYLEVQPD